jgi:hypothetical protein
VSLALVDRAWVAARVLVSAGALDSALAAKDGKKLLALYGELAGYGRAAWPLAKKLGAIFSSLDEGSDELGLNGMEFFKTFALADFSELYADAFAHPEDYDKEFRKLAIWGISMGDSAAATPTLIQALKVEKDLRTIQQIAGVLAQNPAQPGVADALLDAINAQKNKQARQTLVWTLTRMQGDEATRALGVLVAAATDPQTKQQLEISLKVRSIPVAGLYVYSVNAKSTAEAAGIKAGDVLTTYDGKPLKTWQQLQGTAGEDETAETRTSTIGVYRDGSTFSVSVKGGSSIWEMGITGDFAKGTAR